MSTLLILIGIFLYSAFIVYRKIKQIKNGQFCNCGCKNCPDKKSCQSEDK